MDHGIGHMRYIYDINDMYLKPREGFISTQPYNTHIAQKLFLINVLNTIIYQLSPDSSFKKLIFKKEGEPHSNI